jgi:hypothetical protein
MKTTTGIAVRCVVALLTLGAATVTGAARPATWAAIEARPDEAAAAAPSRRGALAASTSWWWWRRVRVTVSPTTATLAAGASRTFTCTVTGSTDTACTWSVQEGASGGAITSAGLYTAPRTAGTYRVVAKSHADPTKTATATVTVTAQAPAVTVSITPTTASVDACRTYTFSASVSGTSNRAVTWSVSEGSAGGSVSAAGVYSAPSTAGTYHVVATSQADPTKSQSATVTVTERILSVRVSPDSVTVAPGGTVQFTATVTTTCGDFTQTQAVAAATGN